MTFIKRSVKIVVLILRGVYMKKYKLLSVIAILFLASCNLNTNNKTNNISTSSTSKPVIQPSTTVDTKTTVTTKTTEDIISTTKTTIKPTVTQPTQVETKTKQPTTTNSPLKEGIIYDVFGQDVVVYDVDLLKSILRIKPDERMTITALSERVLSL